MLDLVNFSVIHNPMIEANGLCNFKTTDNTFYLPNADELRQYMWKAGENMCDYQGFSVQLSEQIC